MGNPSTGHIGFCLSGNNGGKFETFNLTLLQIAQPLLEMVKVHITEIDHSKTLVICIS